MPTLLQLDGRGQENRAKVDGAASGDLVRDLRKLKHDFSTPIGTLGLELFSMEMVAQRLDDALEHDDPRTASTKLEELRAICANLQGAYQDAARLLRLMESLLEAQQSREQEPLAEVAAAGER